MCFVSLDDKFCLEHHTKNYHFGIVLGVPPLKETPIYIYNVYILALFSYIFNFRVKCRYNIPVPWWSTHHQPINPIDPPTSSTILAHKAPSAWLNKTCQSNSWRRCFFVWALNLRCFWKMIMNMFGCLGTCLVIVCGLWFQPIGKIRSIIFFHFGGGGEEFQKIVETTQLVMV